MNHHEIMKQIADRTAEAVTHYWETRAAQRKKQGTIPGASTKHHPAPFPLELATRLVRMFSFVGDTVLDPFCGSGTTMIAAFRTDRNSIGIEIDPEYCRMSARYLKAENASLFSNAELFFQKVDTAGAYLVKEYQVLYEVKPAKKKLEEAKTLPRIADKRCCSSRAAALNGQKMNKREIEERRIKPCT